MEEAGADRRGKAGACTISCRLLLFEERERKQREINPETGGWRDNGRRYPAAAQQSFCPCFALVFRTFGKLNACPDGCAGGNADQHALAAANQLASGKGIIVFNREDFVIDVRIQYIRNKAGADPLDFMCACNALAEHGRRGGFHSDDLDLRIVFLEEFAGAGQRPAGAEARNKEIDDAIRIRPYLRAGCLVVCFGVGGINKLAGNEAVRDLRGKLFRLGDGALHALGSFGKHQLRAIGLHQLAALNAHGLGHDNDDAIAARSGNRSEADTGIAGGRLNDDRVGLELSGSLRVVKNRLGNAVLDGTCGIEIFQLGEKPGFQLFGFFNMGQFQQGRLPDQLVCGCINLAHNNPPDGKNRL